MYEVVRYRRKIIPDLMKMALNGKEKAGPAEVRTYLKFMVDENYSTFPSLTPEDERKFLEMLPEQARPNLQREKEIGAGFLKWMDGVRTDMNIAVAANLIKIYVLGAEGRDMLHEVAYEETMERMRDAIIYEIFGHLE